MGGKQAPQYMREERSQEASGARWQESHAQGLSWQTKYFFLENEPKKRADLTKNVLHIGLNFFIVFKYLKARPKPMDVQCTLYTG